MDFVSLLLPCVVIAIFLVILFSELIKKLDKKDRLKGYRVYVPAVLSVIASFVLWFGNFFELRQVPFYCAIIFGVSIFGYETILAKLNKSLNHPK